MITSDMLQDIEFSLEPPVLGNVDNIDSLYYVCLDIGEENVNIVGAKSFDLTRFFHAIRKNTGLVNQEVIRACIEACISTTKINQPHNRENYKSEIMDELEVYLQGFFDERDIVLNAYILYELYMIIGLLHIKMGTRYILGWRRDCVLIMGFLETN